MKLPQTLKNSLTKCDMNVITKSSHDITLSNTHISGKSDCIVLNCDITNHITLQNTIMSLNKFYAIEKRFN